MRSYFILMGEGIQWLVSLKKRRGYTETQAERKPHEDGGRDLGAVSTSQECQLLATPEAGRRRPGTDISQSLERDPTCRQLISEAGGQNREGCVSTVWSHAVWGSLSRHPQEAHSHGAVFAKSQNTLPDPPTPTLKNQHRRLGWKCFRGTLQLENGYVSIRHACWWGKTEQRQVDEAKNWGLGKTGKIWKEARGVPGRKPREQRQTWGNADVIFKWIRCSFKKKQNYSVTSYNSVLLF